MICISVTPESRKLARVDLLNASRHGDLIELCLDHLVKEPDVGEILHGFSHPVIVSCRRPQEGGCYTGSDDNRAALLRQAVIAGPAYVELDRETAATIPRFGKTRRVISFTSLDEPFDDVERLLADAESVDPDVIKLTGTTRNLDDAWPMLAAVSQQKRQRPVVGMGRGPAGLTFSLLGQKYGSPWIYAALEKGMEAHPEQPTVWDLNELYDADHIDRQTQFIGVIDSGPLRNQTIQTLNAGFRHLGRNARCLPLVAGGLDNLSRRLSKLRINALVIGADSAVRMLPFADETEPAVRESGSVDLLVKQHNRWHGYNALTRSARKLLEQALGCTGDRSLENRRVLILGAGPIARSLIHTISRRGGILSVTAPDDGRARKLAETQGIRCVPFTNLYDTLTDVLVSTDPSIRLGTGRTNLNPAYLQANTTVLDVCECPGETELIHEARSRGCRIIEPATLFADRISTLFKALTGTLLPTDVIQAIPTTEAPP